MTTTLATQSAPPPAPAAPGSGPTATPAAAPVPPVKQHKIRAKLKNVPFEVALIILTVLTIVLLGIVGQAVNTSVFVNYVLWLTFAFYNLLVMAYPTVLLIIKIVKKADSRWVNLAARGSVIVLSVIVTWFILMFYVRSTGADGGAHYAQNLWKLAFIGPIVAPILAVALNGLAAFFLVHYAADNPQLKEDQAKLLPLEADLREANDKRGRSVIKQAAAHAEVERLKPIVEAADKAQQDAAKEFKKATKALSETKLSKKLNDVKAKQKENEEKRSTLDSILTKLRDKASALTGQQKINRDREIAAKDAEMKPLLKEQARLAASVTALESSIDASPEKIALDAAKATSKAAEKEKTRQDKLMASAEKALSKADSKLGLRSTRVEALETEITDVNNRIREATADAGNLWRDVVRWAVLAGFCLILAYLVFDPAWYGWKLDAF